MIQKVRNTPLLEFSPSKRALELEPVVLQVVVKDGRVLIGEFLCIDKQANLILGNTYQQVQRYNS